MIRWIQPLGKNLAGLLMIALMTVVTTAAGVPSAAFAAAPTLVLSPTSGPPGTVVTLTGFVPGMTTAPPSYRGVSVCLEGCAHGFTEDLVPTHWLGQGRFTARFTIPTVPVLTVRGPLALRDGTYRIGYTCIGPDIFGCAARTMAQAPFRVTGSRQTACTEGHPCATLRLVPAAARPGQMVRVEGFAPLSPSIGLQPFGYQVVLQEGTSQATVVQMGQVQQTMQGDLTASFRVPEMAPGIGLVTAGRARLMLEYQFNTVAPAYGRLPQGVRIVRRGKSQTPGHPAVYGYELVDEAPTALTVSPPMTWRDLGHITPTHIRWSMALPLAYRAGTPGDFAYCVPGGIALTTNGGRTWSHIATESAAVRSMTTAFPIAYNLQAPMPHAACQSVLWDPNAPHTFYASFLAINRRYASAPPFYSVLYETLNGGHTWQPVPVPSGYVAGDFGGMRVMADAKRHTFMVEALFGHEGNVAPSPTMDGLATSSAAAEVTRSGGANWRTEPLSCPASGPCLGFGAMPGMLPGMGTGIVQPLVTSADGGKTWRALTWPSGNVQSQLSSGQSQLADLGKNTVAFVDANSQYALRISADGAKTWQVVALPLPPGASAKAVAETGALPFKVLMLLPNGALLAATSASGTSVHWWILAPGAREWAADPALDQASATLGRLLVVGSRLYWLVPSSGQNAGMTYVGLASAPVPGPTVAALPDGFSSYRAVRSALGPLLRAGASVPVLLPRTIPHDGLVPGAETNIDAAFHSGAKGYSLALFYGPHLPVNAPNVGEGGNAAFLMAVQGMSSEAALRVQQIFGPIRAWMPNAAQGVVSLTHGITATNFDSGVGSSAMRGVQWREDGWTFVIPPTLASNNPDQLAMGLATRLAGLKLPGSNGTAAFGVGPDAPSMAVFQQGHAWYSLLANGWRAATFASSMAP